MMRVRRLTSDSWRHLCLSFPELRTGFGFSKKPGNMEFWDAQGRFRDRAMIDWRRKLPIGLVLSPHEHPLDHGDEQAL